MTSNKRIGLMLPSSNSVQEPELYRTLPPQVTLHVTRLFLEKIEANSTLMIGEQVEDGARRLSHADVDIIVLAATAPSSRKGIGYDRELMAKITAASNRQATTAATALLAAMQELGVKRLALGAPWSEDVNATTANFIEQNGFSVVGRKCLGIVANLEVGRLDAQTAYDVGRQLAGADVDAVMLACGNWSTFPIIEKLEREIGKPVLTTNQVSLWHVFKLLGLGPMGGLGTLMRDHLQGGHAPVAGNVHVN